MCNTLIIEPTAESVSMSRNIETFYENYKNPNCDSGFDLYCPHDVVIPARSFSNKVGMGIKASLKNNLASVGFMLCPRSSTGSKTSLRLSNSIGIIDNMYRGELIACFDNFGETGYTINKGDRLVQIVPFDGKGVSLMFFGELDETDRGSGGFGSTGK